MAPVQEAAVRSHCRMFLAFVFIALVRRQWQRTCKQRCGPHNRLRAVSLHMLCLCVLQSSLLMLQLSMLSSLSSSPSTFAAAAVVVGFSENVSIHPETYFGRRDVVHEDEPTLARSLSRWLADERQKNSSRLPFCCKANVPKALLGKSRDDVVAMTADARPLLPHRPPSSPRRSSSPLAGSPSLFAVLVTSSICRQRPETPSHDTISVSSSTSLARPVQDHWLSRSQRTSAWKRVRDLMDDLTYDSRPMNSQTRPVHPAQIH